MEKYFYEFKKKTIGDLYLPQFNLNGKKIIYADWAASGRLFLDIEKDITFKYGPLYSNTHSRDSYIGEFICTKYKESKEIIRNHFNADDNYAVICVGQGMTSAINKFQNIILEGNDVNNKNPVVFITPYEHNSNYISWLEKDVECIILDYDEQGKLDEEAFVKKLEEYSNRMIIGAFSACSNVTGIKNDLDILIKKIKEYGGIVCIDFTTIAPYESLNLSVNDIDALVFSSHKFLGGVGGPGVLIMKKSLYKREKPTVIGGGVVKWVNRWGDIIYSNDIEEREESGTPLILQTVRAALALKLKERMGVENIIKRERQINKILFDELQDIKGLELYDSHLKDRLSIISFDIVNARYDSVVRELSDSYGIQCRGGCCCAPLYGHRILNINKDISKKFAREIKLNNSEHRMGWVRISLNPIVTDDEVVMICNSIKEISIRYKIGQAYLQNTK